MLGAKMDDFTEALNIVAVTYQPNADRSVPSIVDWPPFGALVPLNGSERAQLYSLRDLIVQYVRLRQHVHPLCIAVFGPPGSGKSFAVKQIQAQAIQYRRQL
jgi:hypothetical protein